MIGAHGNIPLHKFDNYHKVTHECWALALYRARASSAGRRLVAWENHVIPLSNQVARLVVDKRRQGRAL